MREVGKVTFVRLDLAKPIKYSFVKTIKQTNKQTNKQENKFAKIIRITRLLQTLYSLDLKVPVPIEVNDLHTRKQK